jgi:Ca-activated chloride channel family protein
MARRRFAIVLGALVCACAGAPGTTPLSATTVPPEPVPPTVAAPVEPADAAAAVEAGPREWVGAAAASDYLARRSSEQLVGVWVDVPPSKLDRVPLAVALAIDTSGSMDGKPIEHARQAARKVVESMVDGDLITLVSFDGQARTIMAPTVLTPGARRRALATIAELSASGSTALHDGVKAAEMALLGAPDHYLVRRVMVISDGQATVGPTDPQTLGNLAEVGMRHGIQVTALGVGLDYDETTLDAFAVRSSGRLYHLETSDGLPGIVAGEMDVLGKTAAAQAELAIVPAPGVTIVGIDAVRSVMDDGTAKIPLGVMFSGQQRDVLVRVRVDDRGLGQRALASVRLLYRDPADGGVERVHESIVRATVTNDAALVAEHQHDRTQAIIALREASMLAASASKLAVDGDLAMAAVNLEAAETALRKRAGVAKGESERKQMLDGAERLSRAKHKVDVASKAPAAARPAAGRAAVLDTNDAFMAFDGY